MLRFRGRNPQPVLGHRRLALGEGRQPQGLRRASLPEAPAQTQEKETQAIGFTHYWRRKKDFSQPQWEKICLETLDILNRCAQDGILVVKDYDSPADSKGLPEPPEVTPDRIWFNGWKDEGHETFVATRLRPPIPAWWPGRSAKESFDFCKTARKPYDLAVCLVLLSMKRHAPGSVGVSSDGEWDGEWTEARRVYKELFGVDVECPWRKKKVAV